ncbi:MAG: ATP-binding cassette domain-containing protein [Thermoguttaceae bacterium]|nr:ATP-binding cassette domain-containing protein [Thermoguttaceae bacterium]
MDRSSPDDQRQSQILSAFLRKSARSGKLHARSGEEEPQPTPAEKPAPTPARVPVSVPVEETLPPKRPLPRARTAEEPAETSARVKVPERQDEEILPERPAPVPLEEELPEEEELLPPEPISSPDILAEEKIPAARQRAEEPAEPVSVTFPPPIDIDRWITPLKTPARAAKHSSKGASKQNSRDDLVVVSDLHKGYIKGKVNIPVLRGVSFSVAEGEYLSIVGQSGSGKSTLLHLMGTLDIPDSGTVHFDGQRIDNLPIRQRDLLRNRYIGMIFQFYHLIPEMTMIENVLAPLMIRDSVFGYLTSRRAFRNRAKELLEMVGLGHRIHHKPNELSGGEMQRTAIARALITEPRILLADEPTGNLDSKTSAEIVKLLRSLNEQRRLTIIMVTHDTAQAEEADRYIRLVDGQIAETVQRKG